MRSSDLIIPVRDDASEFPEIDRAALFLRALASRGIAIAGKDVIDLGAGMGSLAIGCSRAGARSVQAFDVNNERLEELERRAAIVGAQVEVRQGNLLNGAPQNSVADIAFMIGVAEYAGLWDRSRSVEALQVQVLRAAWESLRPGGMIILGTKNRLWPKLLISDVHTHQPLVAVLPRGLADRLNNYLVGQPYRHHLHSASGWTRLLENAGFVSVSTFVPYFSYQFPLCLEENPSYADQQRIEDILVNHPELAQFAGHRWRSKVKCTAFCSSFHVTVSQSLVLIARK